MRREAVTIEGCRVPGLQYFRVLTHDDAVGARFALEGARASQAQPTR
jgi:hypothetical protein